MRNESPKRLPNEIADFAPEADLRTVAIRRPNNFTQPDDTNHAHARSKSPDELFFTKGLAGTEGFRPAYWSYGSANDIAAGEACAAVEGPAADVSRGDDCLGTAAVQQEQTGGELSGLEHAFLEVHRHALMQEPGSRTDNDGTTRSERQSSAPANPDLRAPLADLRIVQLRPSGRDAARLDGLFVRKSHAAAEDASLHSMQDPDAIPAREAKAGVVTTVVGPPISLDGAPPMREPMQSAEKRVGAIEASGVGLDEMLGAAAPERPIDAVLEATSVRASTGRRSLLAPIQEAIIVFGCVALLASLRVFNPSDAPPPLPVVAQEQPQAAAPEAHRPAAAVADFLVRGDERLRSGDVVGARLFYEKAADAGNAHGALMLGATFDPKFLASIGVYGLRGDEQAALSWYRRAGELGDPGAAKLGSPARK